MKVRGNFLCPPHSTDKTTLIDKVRKGASLFKITVLDTGSPTIEFCFFIVPTVCGVFVFVPAFVM